MSDDPTRNITDEQLAKMGKTREELRAEVNLVAETIAKIFGAAIKKMNEPPEATASDSAGEKT